MDYRTVTQMDGPFLYRLLEERDAMVNISHKAMPSYAAHINFILSEPYKEWKIASRNGVDVGSYYLTHANEIGIFIRNEFQRKGLGTTIMNDILDKPGRYLANISPRNKSSQLFFCNHGFKRVQFTYELEV